MKKIKTHFPVPPGSGKESSENECFKFVPGKAQGWKGKYGQLCTPQAGMTGGPVNTPCSSFRRKICIILMFSVLNIKLGERFHFKK